MSKTTLRPIYALATWTSHSNIQPPLDFICTFFGPIHRLVCLHLLWGGKKGGLAMRPTEPVRHMSTLPKSQTTKTIALILFSQATARLYQVLFLFKTYDSGTIYRPLSKLVFSFLPCVSFTYCPLVLHLLNSYNIFVSPVPVRKSSSFPLGDFFKVLHLEVKSLELIMSFPSRNGPSLFTMYKLRFIVKLHSSQCLLVCSN